MALTAAEKQSAYRERKKSEDAYVKKMMALPPLVGPDGIENARARQEEYARWRWAGVQSGEVASL